MMKRITWTEWSNMQGRYVIEDVADLVGLDPLPPPGMQLAGYEWITRSGDRHLFALGQQAHHITDPPHDLRPLWAVTEQQLVVESDRPAYRIESRRATPHNKGTWEYVNFTGASDIDLDRITTRLQRQRERADSASWQFRLVQRRSVHLASEWKEMNL